MGVTGIKLTGKTDHVVGMIVVRREGTVLAVTEKGFGKRTEIINYRVQNRAGKGIITVKVTAKVGKMLALLEVVDQDDLMIITGKGVLIRLPISKIRSIGRNTQGVHLIRLDDKDTISAVTRVQEDADEKHFSGDNGMTGDLEYEGDDGDEGEDDGPEQISAFDE